MARQTLGRAMDRATDTYRRLRARYGPQHWWPADSPFEVVVGALLMPQTSWKNVEVAIANLKAAGLMDVRALAREDVATIRRHVRVAGLHGSKPARLRSFARHLVDGWDGDVARFFDRPTDEVRADLLAQPGVGPETADSILLYAGGHPVFVVDAYTVRIGTRLGLFRATDYDAVQRYFERRTARDLGLRREYHALLDEHAKALCRPRPRCGECPLRTVCATGRRQRS